MCRTKSSIAKSSAARRASARGPLCRRRLLASALRPLQRQSRGQSSRGRWQRCRRSCYCACLRTWRPRTSPRCARSAAASAAQQQMPRCGGACTLLAGPTGRPRTRSRMQASLGVQFAASTALHTALPHCPAKHTALLAPSCVTCMPACSLDRALPAAGRRRLGCGTGCSALGGAPADLPAIGHRPAQRGAEECRGHVPQPHQHPQAAAEQQGARRAGVVPASCACHAWRPAR